MKKLKKRGFTLAEALITLAIVSVVAAMTVPNLVEKYQKHITVNRLKTSYTNLQNALQLSISENGDMSTWNFSDNRDDFGVESRLFFDEYIAKYYKKLKFKNHNAYTGRINTIDGKDTTTAAHWIVLPDGTAMATTIKLQGYIWIYIDINADKKPNRLGKDIFMLRLLPKQNSLIFQGQGCTNEELKTYQHYACAKNTNGVNAGGTCGAKILQDGWKIADDYPWK